MKTSGIARAAVAVTLLGLLSGCEAEVQHGLSEKDATQIRVMLSKHNIPTSTRLEQGGNTAAWTVVVPRGEASRAMELMVANHLPPDHQPGLIETFGKDSLVPTAMEEKAKWITGVQGDMSRTLESVDGVLNARVNVNLPETSDLDDKSKKAPPTASVVVTYRRQVNEKGELVDKPPFTEAKIKALVAHGVPDLTPENVEVAMTPASLPGGDTGGENFVDFAGLRLAKESVGTFQSLAAGAILAILALAGWIGMLYWRGASQPQPSRRSRAAPEA